MDEYGFRKQFGKLRPVALSFFRTGEFTVVGAWKECVAKTGGRNRIAYPIDDLLPPLVGFATWKISSSGVEQTFSIRNWIMNPRRNLCADYELNELTVVTHNQPKELPKILELAREVWENCFGEVRTATKGRLRGWKRKAPLKAAGDVQTRNEFVKRRREETSAAVKLEPTLTQTQMKEMASAAVGDRWTDTHQKEMDRQVAQRRLRLLESGSQGMLLPEELDAGTREQVKAWENHNDKKRQYRDAADKRKAEMMQSRDSAEINLFGHSVHVAPGLLAQDEVSNALMKTHMRRSTAGTAADVFVVGDVTKPGAIRKWAAVMCGAMLIDVPFFVSNGERGTCLNYHPAARVKKYIWISPGFDATYPELNSVLKMALAKRGSQWSRLLTLDEFQKKVSMNERNAARFVAIVDTLPVKDAMAETLPGPLKKTVMLPYEFVMNLAKLDYARSITNLG